MKNDLDFIPYSDPQVRHQRYTSFYGPYDYSFGSGCNTVTLKTLYSTDQVNSIKCLKDKIEQKFNSVPNSCQVNWYKGAKCVLNLHKDDEPILDHSSYIFISKYGSSRKMKMMLKMEMWMKM